MKRPRQRVRHIIRSLGWDVVRYQPMWPTLLGVEQLPIRTVLDIGAYDGDTARIFRRIFPDAHIYCFEPQLAPLQTLNAWAATQQGMVHVLPVALGDFDGVAEMYCNPNVPTVASLTRPGPGDPNGKPNALVQSIPIAQLDRAVSALDHVADGLLVKLDVEGSERAVLTGGAQTLQRCAACIMEFHAVPRFTGQMDFHEGYTALLGFGLEFKGVLTQQMRGQHLAYLDVLFVNPGRIDAIRPR